ncbi:MAG: hypothetical protein IJ644_01235 [Oscillospiraceae bacterium]|nr:hypothetical protein [Oscillospiraceae bacterium]
MKNPLEKKICPYCMNVISKKSVKYFCDCGKEAVRIGFPKKLQCTDENCTSRRYRMTCPYDACKSELPTGILDYNGYLRFSLIGLSGAGKSNFLTAMIHEMRLNSTGRWVISHMNPDTFEAYRRNEEKMFTHHEPVPATRRGSIIPQQWSISDTQNSFLGKMPVYSLTIFDGAGEDEKSVEPVIANCIQGSKTLVILFDPLSIRQLENSMDKNIYHWSTSSNPNEYPDAMITSLTNYIRNCLQLPPSQKIKKDVAVVFTKIDTLKKDFENSVVMQESPHIKAGGFVEQDSIEVDNQIRSWLKKNGQDAFLGVINKDFYPERVRFFGVSSIGNPPVAERTFGVITPHRVLDPLMWMMYRENIIPEKTKQLEGK